MQERRSSARILRQVPRLFMRGTMGDYQEGFLVQEMSKARARTLKVGVTNFQCEKGAICTIIPYCTWRLT